MSDIYNAPKADLIAKSEDHGPWGSVESALTGNYALNPMALLQEAWDTLKGLKTPFWLGVIVLVIVSIVVEGIRFYGLYGGTAPSPETMLNVQQLFGELLLGLASVFITAPLSAGLFIICLTHAVGGKAEVGQIFGQYDKTLKLVGLTLVTYILVFIGIVFLILPGLYLVVTLSMAMPLMVDKNMGIWESLSVSRRALHRRFFSVTGFYLFCLLIIILGALAFLIGLLWAMPVVTLAFAIAYRNIFGVDSITVASSYKLTT